MNELIHHIEILLLSHDCVIIPQFGGFVAHYTPAQWQADEKRYLPPTRSIGFNPLLTLNDGLLVQSYMKAYDTDFPDANRKMERDVRKLVQRLHEETEIYLNNIGSLSVDMDDNYHFVPAPNGLMSPIYYGLSAFQLCELGKAPVLSVPDYEKQQHRKNVYEIYINRTLLHNLVAVAVAVIAFFILSTPVENTYVEADNYAMLFPLELTSAYTNYTKHMEQPANKSIVQAKKVQPQHAPAKPKAVRVEKVKSEQAQTSHQTAKNKQNKQYHIIVGSVTSQSEAQMLLGNYAKNGYTNMKVLEGNGRIRICMDSFFDKNAAYNQLNQIKKTTPFKDAWLLRQ